MDDSVSSEIVVVGGGAAGLCAAASAARAGMRTIVIDRMDRPAMKVLSTGGGRCNLTNMTPLDAWYDRFGRSGRFISDALRSFGPDVIRRMFDDAGVATKADDSGRVYPSTERSSDVRNALIEMTRGSGATIDVSRRATGLELDGNRVTGVRTDSGIIRCTRAIIATGGRACPALGGGMDGYEMARQCGHTIEECVPALVGLIVTDEWVHELSGTSVGDVRMTIDGVKRPRPVAPGDVLFTHRGVSGPVVLDLSGDVAGALSDSPAVGVRLEIAGRTPLSWRSELAEMRTRDPERRIGSIRAPMPGRLKHVIVERAGCSADQKVGRLGNDRLDALSRGLARIELTVTGTEGFERAMVTRGGVSLKEVDPRTMASRLVRGLLFAGEVLDIDGPCGGFNLQWAFASGCLAGRSAAGDR